jgi:predicted PurR-regulated permease PerM
VPTEHLAQEATHNAAADSGQGAARLGPQALGPLVPLATIVLVMIGALALREIATIIVPVVFGLFLALVAWPMVGVLERRGARHAIALTAALMVVLAIVLVAGGLLAVSVTELVLQVPKYEGRLRDQIELLQDFLAQLGITTDPGALLALIKPEQILSIIRPVASALSGAGLTIFVLTFTMIYALFGASSLQARARQAFGERHALIMGIERFGMDLRRYLLVRAQLGVFAAVLAFLLLLVLGVPFAALWAFLVFAASFIPNIGTFIAVIPPTIMAFLSGGLLPAVAVIVGYTLINFAQDHFLQPVMMGSELNLSPLVVFISVLTWAWILGAAGAVLAVPLTVGLVAIMEAYPASRDMAALLRNTIEPPTGSAPNEDAFTAPSD